MRIVPAAFAALLCSTFAVAQAPLPPKRIPPAGITLAVEGNNKVIVSGISKQAVGEVAANIRKLRKPEPYKGKGVRYEGEVVRRKAGKAGK